MIKNNQKDTNSLGGVYPFQSWLYSLIIHRIVYRKVILLCLFSCGLFMYTLIVFIYFRYAIFINDIITIG